MCCLMLCLCILIPVFIKSWAIPMPVFIFLVFMVLFLWVGSTNIQALLVCYAHTCLAMHMYI